MRRILRMEKKNRTTVPIQIERELVIAMELRGLDRHNTVNIALEKHLLSMNVPIEQQPAAMAVKA
jgi:hypothetical protein